MRVAWNSHPNYRAEKPRIVHCSYVSMLQRIEVMQALVKDPTFDYPKYNKYEKDKENASQEEATLRLESDATQKAPQVGTRRVD